MKGAKTSVHFVRFEFGDPSDPQVFGVCDSMLQTSLDGVTYYGEPALELDIAQHTGGFDDTASLVYLPKEPENQEVADFLTQITGARAFGRVKMVVFELRNNEEIRYLDRGRGATTKVFPFGSKKVEIKLVRERERLNAEVGFNTTSRCEYPYGGFGCGKPIPVYQAGDSGLTAPNARRVLCVATFVEGRTLTLEPAAPLNAPADYLYIEQQLEGWWERGRIEADGVSLVIRNWARLTRVFEVNQYPPLSWEGGTKQVWLVPGCGKTPLHCAQRGQATRFMGLGYCTPAYNPAYDVIS